MKWSNLKKNKCPKCGKELAFMFFDGRDKGQLLFCKCGFKILPERMKEIVTSQVNTDLDRYFREREEERKNWE